MPLLPLPPIRNILLVLINNKKAISKDEEVDIRYSVLLSIGKSLKERNFNIYVSPCDKDTKISSEILSTFQLYQKSVTIDFLICWSPVLDKFRKHISCPYLSYENGHLKDSIIIDPNGLLEKSKYVRTLNQLCESNYNSKKCQQYIEYYKSNNLSKREQPKSISDIPPEINGKYVFIPTQFHLDISLKNSKLKMMDCVKKVMKLCKSNQIPLVVKIHPHLKGHHKRYQKDIIKKLRRKYYKKVYISKMSINTLMTNALFTVTLNGSTIMDNFINQTPVLVILKCLYSDTDAVIHDTNLKRGFQKILSKDYNLKEMLEKQRKIIWGYLQNNLSYKSSASQNISIIEKHFESDVSFNKIER